MSSKKSKSQAASKRDQTIVLVLVVIVIITAISLFARPRVERETTEFQLGDFSGENITDAQSTYQSSGEADDLIHLLKVLCYQTEKMGNTSAQASVQRYGSELLAMDREGVIDLDAMAETDGTIPELLGYLDQYGAK